MDYSKIVSEKVKSLKPSGIRKFFDLVANTEGVISLGVGEPDFVTPRMFTEAAIESIDNGETTYTSNWGCPDLRKSIRNYLINRYSLNYSSENEIIVTVGTSEALDLALRSIVNPGDEVMIPEPCYVSYEPGVILADGKAVYIKTKVENKFKLTVADLEKAITPNSKILILPYPSNPTGAIMTKEDLMPIAKFVIENDLFVISDELYSELTYGKKHFSFVAIPKMRERTLLINGLSKAFAMTGWRVGYICGPSEVVAQIVKIHQYTMLCASIMSQRAAKKALDDGLEICEEMVSIYNERREYLVNRLNAIGLPCFTPEGAFYAFPSIENTGLEDEDFAERLLLEKGVAVVPGSAFGPSGKGHLRLCYASSMENIVLALDKIEEFLNELKVENGK